MSDSTVCSPLCERFLRLHLCQDVGPIRAANLLRELGDIDSVLDAGVQSLMRASGIGEKVAAQVVRDRGADRATREIELAARARIRIYCVADDAYPVSLKNIPDPPLCLYVCGTLQREDAVALGIVGSRYCSHYGAEQAERFAALAANAGFTIVSGMARGVDSAAHRGALAAGGRTIAVLGCGLHHLYPAESRDLADQIIQQGALVSELPLDIAPDAKNFPPRNRIITGLSLGVVIVEAAKRSGALITARLGNEYNREVFAVPGRIDGPHAEGCHELIKTGAAKLVTCLPDILDELGPVGETLRQAPRTIEEEPIAPRLISLDETERQILDLLGVDPLPVDAVCQMSMLPVSRVAAVLTALQLKGQVRRVGNNYYERIGRA